MKKEEVENKCYDYYIANGKDKLTYYIESENDGCLSTKEFGMLDGNGFNEAKLLIAKWEKEPQPIKPTQYNITIDTFKRAESNMTLPERMACVKFNIDKYNWRNKSQDKEDLEKIIAYANWGLKQLNK